MTEKSWNIGGPGGPAGPFYSVVKPDGQIVAMQILTQEMAELIASIPQLQAEIERLRVELERAQDAFRVIGYSPAYEQRRYAFEIGADEPSKGYSHWSWYPIAIARFMRDKIRKLPAPPVAA